MLIHLCAESMKQRFEKKGAQAFDTRYLEHYNMMEERQRLVTTSTNNGDTPDATKSESKEDIHFDGATEFFFLGASLLHVSLYPMMRVERAFHQQYNQLLVLLQDLEKKKNPVPPHLKESSQTAVVAWMGFDAFMDDPEWLAKMTPFALTQLQWIQALQKDPAALSRIPDWFVKEAARWLTHVAHKVPTSLTVHQADLAVDVVTSLLSTGSRGEQSSSFSPLVLTELVHVASAFVDAGARRAKRKQGHQRRRGFGAQNNDTEQDYEDNDVDDPNIYTSFDQNDLGVAVFTNRRVCEELGPALLKNFRHLDHIIGLNIDAEANFDKFSVKVEIARLLIRLWRHPNGECRKSIVGLEAEEIRNFASSVAAAIGYLLDDACQRYSDVIKLSRRDRNTWSPQDRSFHDKQTRGAVSCFLCGRTLLLLLIRLSEVDTISRAIGSGKSSAKDMASMLVHFLDILTDPDGGTHPDLDPLPQHNRTSQMLQRSRSMLASEKAKLASNVVATRHQMRQTIGLDVSELCHMLLGLGARWFVASAEGGGESVLVSALASLDDCDIERYQAVSDRMIPKNELANDPGTAVFRHDGYVNATVFQSDASAEPLTELQRGLTRSARQCHLSHDDISKLVKQNHVDALLKALQVEKTTITPLLLQDNEEALEKVMVATSFSEESEYGDMLVEYTVSSQELSNSIGDVLHFFGKTAQDRGTSGSGKVLVKEARKCFKCIPIPHPNSAVFICFDERRMDLCRAIVTGPVDSPYSLGVFVFDVYFPLQYPHIPPLVQFMTTGGGQVRFGPNLYQDGKVCLSLLVRDSVGGNCVKTVDETSHT